MSFLSKKKKEIESQRALEAHGWGIYGHLAETNVDTMGSHLFSCFERGRGASFVSVMSALFSL
jgi:hypothetical protein